jgi:hypothetical protein
MYSEGVRQLEEDRALRRRKKVGLGLGLGVWVWVWVWVCDLVLA